MSPLGGQPGVVEIEPADHGADAEGGLDRVQLVARAGHAGAAGQHGPGDDGADPFATGRVAEGQQPTAQRVEEAMAGRLPRLRAVDPGGEGVVGDFLEQPVGLGAPASFGSSLGHVFSSLESRLCRRPAGRRTDSAPSVRGLYGTGSLAPPRAPPGIRHCAIAIAMPSPDSAGPKRGGSAEKPRERASDDDSTLFRRFGRVPVPHRASRNRTLAHRAESRAFAAARPNRGRRGGKSSPRDLSPEECDPVGMEVAIASPPERGAPENHSGEMR